MRSFSKSLKVTVLVSICSILLSSFAHAQNTAPATTTTNDDPLKPYNHVVFKINSGFNDYFMTPVAKGYNFILPNAVKKSISNFFSNVNTVTVIANDLLQFKFFQAYSDSWRLLINTTVGIGGLFDPATPIGIERHREEFGLTLAYWGYENSSYFIIPILGPSTIRDTIGLGGDYALSVYPYINNAAISYGALGLFFVSYRAEIVDLQEIEEQAALDRYAFEKNAYLQHRAYLIEQNKGEASIDNYVPDNDDETTNKTKTSTTKKKSTTPSQH